MTSRRILFIGENWFGSCARACCYSLRRLGHLVKDVDAQLYSPPWRNPAGRVGLRLLRNRLIEELNGRILRDAELFLPEILLIYKGTHVEPETIEQLRRKGVWCYNYFPDSSFFTHGERLIQTLQECDCIFYTKPNHETYLVALGAREGHFVRHGYDPQLHRIRPVDERKRQELGHDVLVIGTHNAHKESILTALADRCPDLDLGVWGNLWEENCQSPTVRGTIRGSALEGELYVDAIRSARINLALMSGPVQGAPGGDETSTRTFEIPACGGFMIHERSPELDRLFVEGEEVVGFETAEELVTEIQRYLEDDEGRARIARAGHERCVPAYSYDERMRDLIEWHETRIDGA